MEVKAMEHLAPAKFRIKDHVQFKIADDLLTGVIELTDFAHFSSKRCHSYSISVEERGCSFLHVPEFDILKKIE